MERKIILIDVDGTLVDYEGKLPESAVKAIRMARAKGHLVYMCTGRSRAEVYPPLWDIGLDGLIGGNGSYVEHHEQVVMHQTLSLADCTAIVDWLHGKNLSFYIESNSGLYASETFETDGQRTIREYAGRKDMKGADQLTIRQAFPDMIFGGELCRDDVNKISYVLGSYQDRLDAEKAFPGLKHGTWGGAGETALFGDIGVPDISKATAIETLLKFLGADRKDTIAIGDAAVDIPMLEYCEIGIAMGSGGDGIKAMADYVTAGVDEDGLYKAFEHFALI